MSLASYYTYLIGVVNVCMLWHVTQQPFHHLNITFQLSTSVTCQIPFTLADHVMLNRYIQMALTDSSPCLLQEGLQVILSAQQQQTITVDKIGGLLQLPGEMPLSCSAITMTLKCILSQLYIYIVQQVLMPNFSIQ